MAKAIKAAKAVKATPAVKGTKTTKTAKAAGAAKPVKAAAAATPASGRGRWMWTGCSKWRPRTFGALERQLEIFFEETEAGIHDHWHLRSTEVGSSTYFTPRTVRHHQPRGGNIKVFLKAGRSRCGRRNRRFSRSKRGISSLRPSMKTPSASVTPCRRRGKRRHSRALTSSPIRFD